MSLKNQNFLRRLAFAIAGLRHAFRTERSFRTHVLCLGLVVIVLVVLRPALVWWAMVGLVAALVLFAELVNSAIEKLVDFLHPENHQEIKLVKDMAAGSVLVAAIAALWVGGILVLSLLVTWF